jgi:hypothetical protein
MFQLLFAYSLSCCGSHESVLISGSEEILWSCYHQVLVRTGKEGRMRQIEDKEAEDQ